MDWSVLVVIMENDWFHLHVAMACVSRTPTLLTSASIKPHGTHPDPTRAPRHKDYILVKQSMMPSNIDTRVFVEEILTVITALW